MATVAPAWFVAGLPLRAEPGVAQVSDGWRTIGRIELVSQSAYASDALWRAGLHAAELLALVGLVGAGLAAWGLRAIRRPLDAAAQQAHALQEGRFVTVPEPDVAELRPLARSMNTMVNRLSTMFDAQARQVEALRQQVQTDPLTGLLNRRRFMLEAQQRFESSAGAAQGLLLLRVGDLDERRESLQIGHAAVDQMLRGVAETLRALLAAPDQPLLGRLNGSDFAVVISRDDASALARELLPRLRDVAQRLDAQASMCAGAADSAQTAGLQAAIAAADQALAQAESQGPFTVVGRPCGDHRATLGERDWQRQLSEALQEGRSSLGEYPVCDAQGALLQLTARCVQLQRGGGAGVELAGLGHAQPPGRPRSICEQRR